MLNVIFTVDVEIWCDGWSAIDQKYPAAFNRYIYGRTSKGDYGLPFQVKLLREHGLQGVFFVEPLYSARFGRDSLCEIVDLIKGGEQEVQLHLHTEWVDESKTPLLPSSTGKRQHMRFFSEEEQTSLIATGKELLLDAGAPKPSAFRAGSFALNVDTLKACAANDINYDSSYNASMFGADSGVSPGVPATEPFCANGICEIPMTVYREPSGTLRHAQLTACSSKEIEALMWQALELGRSTFVILCHSGELVNRQGNRPDPVMVRRMRNLFSFLDSNRDVFNIVGFNALDPITTERQPALLQSTRWLSLDRKFQQAYRRIYR